jgi:hypothetical protein
VIHDSYNDDPAVDVAIDDDAPPGDVAGALARLLVEVDWKSETRFAFAPPYHHGKRRSTNEHRCLRDSNGPRRANRGQRKPTKRERSR